MKINTSTVGRGLLILVWCLFMGVTAISIGVGALVPQLNYVAGPFVCPGGTMSVAQKGYTVSPVETVTSIYWYCINRTTGARTELSMWPMSIVSGLFYGLLLFLVILVAIPFSQRFPQATKVIGYALIALFVGGITLWNLSSVFSAFSK